jgi:DMSO/TMAO reductase YedYZ heme-binding membrane subunit
MSLGQRLPLFAFVLLLVATVVQWMPTGFNEDFVRAMIRVTAQLSIILFLIAFMASALHRLFAQSWSRALLQHRRYVGLSFAVSHFTHLLFLCLLVSFFPREWMAQVPLLILSVALAGYVLLAAMTVTSFEPMRTQLGAKNWRRLHVTGMYVIWLIFVQTYAAGLSEHPSNGLWLSLLILGLVLRFIPTNKGI